MSDKARRDGRPIDDDRTVRRSVTRRTLLKRSAAVGVAAAAMPMLNMPFAGADPSSVAAENALSGSAPAVWESEGSDTIVGFTTDFSVAPGDTVVFKIKTPSNNYRIRIFRLGYYGGNGARLIATVTPSASLPQNQPEPVRDASTKLADCGNWAPSATWTVPSATLSGVYYAKLERLDVANQSNHILFVVRRTGPSDLLVQTSESTWQAYNYYGGASLYMPTQADRAFAVSYNRPLTVQNIENDFFASEYPLIRWLERNGYDVAYCGNIDVHRNPGLLLNRKVFLSSGHDEYWSGAMRSGVQAARDAGINLIFFSGNEMFWRVRFGPSIDNSATADRTMICYKETLADARIDPSSQWTGSWRDPRFSPPAIGGGQPENGVTGQLFRCINQTGGEDPTITVPFEYSGLRFWRNTSVAQLTAGQVRSLGEATLGYEWDVDVENSSRPFGLIRLSATTAHSDAVLVDHGGIYQPGTETHHLTMYRAASGALVFGAGTCQWAYGLDSYHLSDQVADNRDIQQATLNMLADMGAQPGTRQSDLVAAAPPSDTLPPVSTITGPTSGSFPVGTAIVVTGTASDAGGVVASVEVSVDGGTSWARATGTTAWSYTFIPTTQLGPCTIKARAIDDSLNVEAEDSGVTIVLTERSLPCSIWTDATTPTVVAHDDASPVEVGVRFRPTVSGFITGLRFFKGAGNTGNHVGHLWSGAGELLSTTIFTNETTLGWQTSSLDAPVSVQAGVTYVASCYMPSGHYALDGAYFLDEGYEVWPLRALKSGENGPNGVYLYGSPGFPTSTFAGGNYWVDVVFDNNDQLAPIVGDHSPGNGVESVATGTTIKATFSEPVKAATVVLQVRRSDGTEVAGALAYDAPTKTAIFTPAAPLVAHDVHAVSVLGAEDMAGNVMTEPFSWSFTTTGAPGTVPTSIWDTATVPSESGLVSETSSVELGVRFQSTIPGLITALRFYKAAASGGPHVGHLWSNDGTLLSTVAFAAETRTGWQQANLPTPIPVNPGASYVASLYLPSGVFYAALNAFTSGGASRGPLAAPASSQVGGNGVFRYGPSGFPTSSYLGSNYFVDVVLKVPADAAAPQVVDQFPAPDLIAVAPNALVSATFDEAIDQPSLTFTLRTAAGAIVNTAVSYDAQSKRATLTPSAALVAGATYTAAVRASDPAGNVMPETKEWTFRVATAAGGTPATLWMTSAVPTMAAQNDTSPIEIGVRFSPSRDLVITGIRFYKGAGNAGTHVGHLWTASGTLLASKVFTSETATGWQQVMFDTPVAVTGGSSYVASYHAPQGRYAVDYNYFNASTTRAPLTAGASSGGAPNGIYLYGSGGFPTNTYQASNYWVDVIADDLNGPTVTGQSPNPGAVLVETGASITVAFSEDVAPNSVVIELRDGGGGPVGGTTSQPTARVVKFQPNAPLSGNSPYTATVVAAADVSGNPIAGPISWSFSTGPAGAISVWGASVVPAVTANQDDDSYELGVKFRASSNGNVIGLRFYRGEGNDGPHVGHLWDTSGQQLAEVTFPAGGSLGWLAVAFPTPVAITAGTVYVASYRAPTGHYALDRPGFANAVANGPLEMLSDSAAGGNGMFAGGSGFPSSSWQASNYWVDVVFLPN